MTDIKLPNVTSANDLNAERFAKFNAKRQQFVDPAILATMLGETAASAGSWSEQPQAGWSEQPATWSEQPAAKTWSEQPVAMATAKPTWSEQPAATWSEQPAVGNWSEQPEATAVTQSVWSEQPLEIGQATKEWSEQSAALLTTNGSQVTAWGEQPEARRRTTVEALEKLSGRVREIRPRVAADSATGANRSLRVIHVCRCLVQGGIEQWLLGLLRFANPERMRIERCLVTSTVVDRQLANAWPGQLEIGASPESIQRACRDCDVLLLSDPMGVHEWIAAAPPAVSVMVAHGDCHWIKQRLELVRPFIDHVVAVSHHVRDNACQGFDCSVIPNGVDAARLARSRPRTDSRRRFGFGPQDFVLGWLGRFCQEKNPFGVIDAVAALPPEFKLLLVGYGEIRDQLMDAANDLIPGRFAVVRKDNYLGDVYGAMDAFCMTSFTEGFGLAALEAMMSGLPLIATPVGIAADSIVDHVNGLIVDGEPESIRDAALFLKQNPDHRRAIIQASSDFADRTGHASTMTRAYEDLLRRLWLENVQQPTFAFKATASA